MRIVDHKTFLAMPAGTIFSKAEGIDFDSLQVKGDTRGGDFTSLDIIGNYEFDDMDELVDRYEAMAKHGASVPFAPHAMVGDGCFDEKQMFLIYEPDDLRVIRALIDQAIAVTEIDTPDHFEKEGGQ